VGGGGGS